MAYTLDFGLSLGSSQTGLASTLRAQLVNTAGANVGGPISTGFSEIGVGNYLWHYAAIPDAHRGGVKFYRNDTGAIMSFAPVNPEDAEYVDTYVSTRATSIQGWTGAEKEQIRSALGIDGAKTAAVSGQLQDVKIKTDALGAVSVTIQQPLTTTGNLVLIAGDDYDASNSTQVDFTDTGNTWPALTGTAEFRGKGLTKSLVIITPTGAGKKVRLVLTASESALVQEGKYRLVSIDATGKVTSFWRGSVIKASI